MIPWVHISPLARVHRQGNLLASTKELSALGSSPHVVQHKFSLLSTWLPRGKNKRLLLPLCFTTPARFPACPGQRLVKVPILSVFWITKNKILISKQKKKCLLQVFSKKPEFMSSYHFIFLKQSSLKATFLIRIRRLTTQSPREMDLFKESWKRTKEDDGSS